MGCPKTGIQTYCSYKKNATILYKKGSARALPCGKNVSGVNLLTNLIKVGVVFVYVVKDLLEIRQTI